MKSSSAFPGTALGLILLFGLMAGAYFLFKYVVGVFAALDPQVETLAWIASVVALFCAVIIAEGLKAGGQDDSILTAEKLKLYETLLSRCCDRLSLAGEHQPDASREFARIEQSLALHASPRVVYAYLDLRPLIEQRPRSGDTAAALGKLLAEMRADFGATALIRNETDLLDMLLGRASNGVERSAGTPDDRPGKARGTVAS